MNKIRLNRLAALLVIIAAGFIIAVYAFPRNNLLIGPFDSAKIKLDTKSNNETMNYSDIQVAFDEEGEALADDIQISFDSRKPNILILTPPPSGWRPETTYYAIVGTKAKAIAFKTKPYVYKTIKGIVKLEEGEKAFEDIDIEVNAWNYEDEIACFTGKTKILIGQSSAQYTLKVPVNSVGYSLGYYINSNNHDTLLNNEYYINPGYIDKDNLVSDFSNRRKHYVNRNINQDFIIPTDQVLKSKVEEILANTIQPGMTEYEKEVALYKYIIDKVEYDQAAFDNGNHTDTFLYAGLINNKTICVGYAAIMKLLLNKAGIECSSISGGTPSGTGHVWNIVKIEGNYYHLDATSRKLDYLNFTDEQANYDYGDYTNNSVREIKCESYELNYRFNSYWKEKNIEAGKTIKMHGLLSLPQNETAPIGGLPVRIRAFAGITPLNMIYVVIPEGESSINYSITLIPTQEPYSIVSSTNNGKVLFNEIKRMHIDASANVNIQLEEARHINANVSLAKNAKKISRDMKIKVFVASDDSNLSDPYIKAIYNYSTVTIPAGENSARVSLLVKKDNTPVMVYYSILNKDDFTDLVEDGYYNKSTGSSPNESRTKLYIGDEDLDINLILRKK